MTERGRPLAMWQAQTERLPAGIRFRIARDETRLSFRELFGLLEHDEHFAGWYSGILAESAFSAFFWEHPPISARSFDREAEFVVLDAPALATRAPDPAPFEAQFATSDRDAEVLVFENLGGDAVLIVPRPIARPDAYPHLASFLRRGPDSQVRSLWRRTASTLRESLGDDLRWLNTSGLGVSWLHLRIDSSPKYYQYGPYQIPT